MKPALTIATLAVIAYDGVIGFMVWFTVAFFGMRDLLTLSAGSMVFWTMAATPFAATAYPISKFHAARRGEHPRI